MGTNPIEIELKSGLNWVVYKNPHTGVKVKDKTILYIKNDNDNDYTSIGTLDEVRTRGARGKGNFIRMKNNEIIGEIGIISGNINITLYADPPSNTVGGKRKTRKSKRKPKRKTKRKMRRKTRKTHREVK